MILLSSLFHIFKKTKMFYFFINESKTQLDYEDFIIKNPKQLRKYLKQVFSFEFEVVEV